MEYQINEMNLWSFFLLKYKLLFDLEEQKSKKANDYCGNDIQYKANFCHLMDFN